MCLTGFRRDWIGSFLFLFLFLLIYVWNQNDIASLLGYYHNLDAFSSREAKGPLKQEILLITGDFLATPGISVDARMGCAAESIRSSRLISAFSGSARILGTFSGGFPDFFNSFFL